MNDALEHDLTLTLPDYDGGSIVNLMSSIGRRFGRDAGDYPPLAVLDPERLAAAQRVALVVIDGLGDELLSFLDRQHTLLPLRAGSMTSVYPPTTATAVTTFMSGQAPQQHGLTGWFMHFRALGAVAAVLPFMPRNGAAPFTTGGISPSTVIDAESFCESIDADAACLLPADLAESDFSRLLGRGARRDGYRDLDEFAAAMRRFIRGDAGADYLYAYWPRLDTLSHLRGPASDDVAGHFAELAPALAALAAAAAASGTLLIVTADHGFIATSAAERIDVEEHPAFAAMLSLPLCGEPRSAYAYVRPDAVQDAQAYLAAELAHAITVHDAAALIADGWFGRGVPHAELRARIGDLVLCMNDRYTLRDQVAGERDIAFAGVHGGTSRAEQIVPLLLAGP